MLGGKNIAEAVAQTPVEFVEWLDEIEVEGGYREVLEPLRSEARMRSEMLIQVGLDYLRLDRSAPTLSGGEAQRVRLASQLGSNLAGACYVLDEPTIGLHPRDTEKMLDALRRLRDRGNTVVVVEHDEQVLREADHVLELGPGGGEHGGKIIAKGTPAAVARKPTATGKLLRGEFIAGPAAEARVSTGAIRMSGARFRNLKGMDVEIPLGLLVCVTGVSGSGKSTLVMDTLGECLQARLAGKKLPSGRLRALDIRGTVGRVRVVDHEPIGRTPRSTPATYIGLWNHLRRLLAATQEARARGYGPSRFSYNKPEGQCPGCKGFGLVKVEMNFLPDVYQPCELCRGRRFNTETLGVKYHGLDAGQILDLSFSSAAEMFSAVPAARRLCEMVCDIGLGYLRLGQPSPTLSGGEAQRIKLVEELASPSSLPAVFLLDEPTTGLHAQDVERLLDVLHRIVERGHTAVVIEHNLQFISRADWIIDLGPEGGEGGGRVVFEGPPAMLLQPGAPGYTAEALRRHVSGVPSVSGSRIA